MQHHGAPTRLLDWTYSPFVAAYFAFEALFNSRQWTPCAEANDKRDPLVPVVWALETFGLEQALKQLLDREDWTLLQHDKEVESFRKLFVDRSPGKAFVSTVTPLRLNERLSVQQGLFLCPGDVALTWVQNLKAVGLSDDDPWRKAFEFIPDVMAGAFDALTRMNVTGRSLFPGLDGYARSTAHRLKALLHFPLPEDKH